MNVVHMHGWIPEWLAGRLLDGNHPVRAYANRAAALEMTRQAKRVVPGKLPPVVATIGCERPNPHDSIRERIGAGDAPTGTGRCGHIAQTSEHWRATRWPCAQSTTPVGVLWVAVQIVRRVVDTLEGVVHGIVGKMVHDERWKHALHVVVLVCAACVKLVESLSVQ